MGKRVYHRRGASYRRVYRGKNNARSLRVVAFNPYHFARRTCRRHRNSALSVKMDKIPRTRIRAYYEYCVKV